MENQRLKFLKRAGIGLISFAVVLVLLMMESCSNNKIPGKIINKDVHIPADTNETEVWEILINNEHPSVNAPGIIHDQRRQLPVNMHEAPDR